MTLGVDKSSALFGAYDVRGRYPKDFPPGTNRRLADALLDAIPGPVVVARDTRRASQALERAIVGYAEARARSVLRLGVQPTPVVGFASAYLGVSGLAFTPSHNALGFAGIKAFGPSGRSFGVEWTRVRRAFSLPGRRTRRGGTPVGSAVGRLRPPWSRSSTIAAYLAHVTDGLENTRAVVVDGRGGATTLLAPRALTRAGAQVRELHPSFSPSFHRLSPEPLRENVLDLGREVRARGSDLGVAFDGDGDRVVFVDERGAWVEPEVIATLLHRNLSLGSRPLVASADASHRCESKAPTVRSRVGGRFISTAMRRHRATVGFEASSHFYLTHWGPNSDGILTACVVCHLLERERTTLSRLSRDFGTILRDRQQIDFGSRAEAARRFRQVASRLAPHLQKGIDGYIFSCSEGSILFRLSNTQPTIRILFEPEPKAGIAGLRRTWVKMAGSEWDRAGS